LYSLPLVSYREGIVINTVTYNDGGLERPVFYRMSLSEMVVPYGAPEHPHPRKFAFDVGEYGMGMLANSLELGCDCLGTIKYIDGVNSGHDGKPVVVKNAICIHEEDAGILWKHSDFRPGGRAHAVRSRKLLIQFTATVANYEYIIVFAFKQDGTVECEVKLTGILNLYLMQQGEDVAGVGTQVAPRVMAHNHQHLFSLRLDPMVDGVKNSIYETNVQSYAEPTGSKENFGGNGFYYTKTLLGTTDKAIRDWSSESSRTWQIGNQEAKHYSTGNPVGYKIMGTNFPPLYAKPDSYVGRRAPFAKHHLWAVPYKEGRLYPAGKYVPQTKEAPEDSLVGWGKGSQNLEQEDLLVFLTFGVTWVFFSV
jgi:primary-amine oxidase